MIASEDATTMINAHQLHPIAMNTAAGYTLGQNVNASATGNGGDVWGSPGFAPIGNLSTPFTGTLNGAGIPSAVSRLSAVRNLCGIVWKLAPVP